jgi:glycyl-tRNA synthetase
VSESLYEFSGLRFWNENEIELREAFASRAISVVKSCLLKLNPAWQFYQVEGPILTPSYFIAEHYGDDDVFVTNHKIGDNFLRLRPETTASSYVYAKNLKKKLPLCVYQKGKSFRRELNDGATATKLRFNEFWQLEFQCIYSSSTKADYRAELIKVISSEISRFTMLESRVVASDRLPSYSESTEDIEVNCHGVIGEIQSGWREIASCSIRNDFSEDAKVCEIAIGLDRVATLAAC